MGFLTGINGFRGASTAGEFMVVLFDTGESSTMWMRRLFLAGGGGDAGTKSSSWASELGTGLGTGLRNGGLKGLFHIITQQSEAVAAMNLEDASSRANRDSIRRAVTC